MLMMDQAAEGNREELRRKLRENFDGRIVRKDLTKKIKEATLYYSQTHNRYINFIHLRNSNANLMAKIVYALSDNVNLIGRYSEVYNDLNGNGKIQGGDEVIEFFNFGVELVF